MNSSVAVDRHEARCHTKLIVLLSNPQHDYSQLYPARSYFTDMVAVHLSLGLGVRYGDAVAIAYMTPKKEFEITVIGETHNDRFFILLVC